MRSKTTRSIFQIDFNYNHKHNHFFKLEKKEMYQKKQTLSIVIAILMLALYVASSQADMITLYELEDHGGASIDIHTSDRKCVNVPREWNDRASSVNTNGKCFLLYEHENCKGTVMKVANYRNQLTSRCLYHNNLKDCEKKLTEDGVYNFDDFSRFNFNDKLSSLKSC